MVQVRFGQLASSVWHMSTSGRVLRILRRLLDREWRETAERWSRSLPTGEYFNDRWNRAETLELGDGASLYDSSAVLGDVKVESHTWIGSFVVLDGSGGLRIGQHCSISAGVQIYSHNTVRWATSDGRDKIERAPTLIGSIVDIGSNSGIALACALVRAQ